MAEVMLCRQCGERPAMPSCVARRRYRCAKCRHSTPAAKARNARYFQTDKRRAVMARDNAKRLFVGRDYHSRVATVEHARAINTHVRQRVRQYVTESRQSR